MNEAEYLTNYKTICLVKHQMIISFNNYSNHIHIIKNKLWKAIINYKNLYQKNKMNYNIIMIL